MNRFSLSKLMILVVILLGWNTVTKAQTVSTFSYTGSPVSYTVPLGVFSLTVDMQGGKGGNSNCSGVGGNGGRVQCTLATTPGQILNIYVGNAGTNYTSSGVVTGGYNGGGNGYQYGGSGGGASDIRVAGTALTNRVVVAGGGGGAGGQWGDGFGGGGGG